MLTRFLNEIHVLFLVVTEKRRPQTCCLLPSCFIILTSRIVSSLMKFFDVTVCDCGARVCRGSHTLRDVF